MKRVFLVHLLIAFAVGIASTGCRPRATLGEAEVASDASTSGSTVDVCPCNDLDCWRRTTRTRSIDNFKCAKDAIGAAFPVLDIPLTMGAAAIEITNGANELRTSAESANAASRVATAVREVTSSACAAAISATISDALSVTRVSLELMNSFRELSTRARAGNIDFKAVSDAIVAAEDPFLKITKLALDAVQIESCLAGAAGAPASVAEVRGWWTRFSAAVFRLERPWKDLDVLKKIDVANKIGKCGIAIVRGAWALGQNTGCMLNDLDSLAASREAVGRALAYVGTRMYNNARFVGCSSCVNSSFRTSADTEYTRCRDCCSTSAEPRFRADPKMRSSWRESCQLTCGIVRTEGIITNYSDLSNCDQVKDMFPVSRTYRVIDLTESGLADRRQGVEDNRAKIVRYLQVMGANFTKFDVATFGPPDGIAGLRDLITIAEREGEAPDLREAARFFGMRFRDNSGIPYYFRLLESSGDLGREDGRFVGDEIRYFMDEIREYRDESEF